MRGSLHRFKFVQAWIDKEGRVHRYFRRPGYSRVRLPGLPGSPEFNRAYEAAMEMPLAVGAKRTKPGTVNAAITGYLSSLQFRAVKDSSAKKHRATLERFRCDHGTSPLRCYRRSSSRMSYRR